MTQAMPRTPSWPYRHWPKLLIVLLAATVLAGGIYFANRPTLETHLAKAASLEQAGNMKAAAIELKNAVQLRPEDGESRWRLGQVYYAMGRLEDADKELTKARQQGVRNDELDILLARTLLELGKADRVLQETTPRQEASTESRARLLVLRGKAQFMTNALANAETSLDEADRLVKDHPDTLFARAQFLYSKGDPAAAQTFLDSAMGKLGNDAKMWVLRGEVLAALHHPADSEQAYLKALALEPWNVPARLELIQRYASGKQLAKAETHLAELRKHAPEHMGGHYLDALVAFHAGRNQEAYGKLQPVVQALPDVLPARLLAGTVCWTLGKREEAQKHLNAVLSINPNHALAQRLMAATLLQAGELDKAKVLLASLKDAAGDPLSASLRGSLALRQGDYADAKRQFEQVIRAQPGSLGNFLELAASEQGLGNLQGVIDALEKAAELDQTFTSDQRLISAYIRAKRFDEALQAVSGMARKNVPMAMLHNARGLVHTARQDLRQARAEFEKALAADPKFMGAVTNLANLDILDKNYKLAASRYENLLKATPDNTNAWIALAFIANLQNDIPAIRSHLEKAKRADPGNAEPRVMLVHYLLNQNKPDLALTEAKEALAATGNASFRELIGLAYTAIGDRNSAHDTFLRWAHDNPDSATALTRLGEAQAAMGQRKEALRTLDRALAVQPGNKAAQTHKMNLLVQDGRTKDALRIAKELQSRDPNEAMGYVGEASALEADKKYSEAARLYVKGAKLAGQGRLLNRAAAAYMAAGNASEAINVLTQWLHANPTDRAVRHALAEQLGKGGRHQEAVGQYRLLLKSQPQDAVAYNNLAMQLLELKDTAAVEAAEQALRLSPDNPLLQDTLGWVLLHNGQGKRGIELLKKAVDKAPEILEIHWHYASGLVAVGNPVLARFELERLINRGKPFPQEQEARKLLASIKS